MEAVGGLLGFLVLGCGPDEISGKLVAGGQM